MINEYYFSPQNRPGIKKHQTSGSFGFRSSQFSQKNNQSIKKQVKEIEPSFFNQSSIKKLDDNESGEFVYFKNDSILSGLDLDIQHQTKAIKKQQSTQKKKNNTINYSAEIQFDDSLQKTQHIQNSNIKQYGTTKSNLPPTLKKPKFAFKTSQTAQSSTVMKDIQESIVQNYAQNQYQLKINHQTKPPKNKITPNTKDISKNYNSVNQSQSLSKENIYKNENNSISSIKKPDASPSIVSKSLSQSNSLSGSMNFKSVFKNKVEKASSLYKRHKNSNSNNSLMSYKSIQKQSSRNDILQNEVKMAQLKNLRELQNQLGKLKHQNKKIIEYMIQKDQQIEKLKKKKIQIESQDPYAIIKENQLMKAFLNNNKKSNENIPSKEQLSYGNCLRSARSLKQVSLKKSSQISSLHDYDVKQHKFKVEARQLTKNEKKMILSNRGVLLSQKDIDVGYSLKDNIVTVYLTLKKQYLELRVKLLENSFIVSDQIDRALKDLPIGKQIKFKTEIKSTKCKIPQDQETPLSLIISVLNLERSQDKGQQQKLEIPIMVYNICKQIEPASDSKSLQKSSRINNKQIFRTQTFVACKQMIRDPQSYLFKLFPLGSYSQEAKVFSIGFVWKQKQDFIKIRIKQRSFLIEGQTNPNHITFQLLRPIVSLLIEPKKQQ